MPFWPTLYSLILSKQAANFVVAIPQEVGR